MHLADSNPSLTEKIRFVRDPTEARQLVDPTQLITGAFGGDLNVSDLLD